jgi:hypothetical protein
MRQRRPARHERRFDVQTTTRTTTAEAIISDLQRLGFTPGAPSRVPADWLEIDRHLAHAMKCGCCHKRGLQFEPFQRDGEYRAVLSCKRCGFAEEA